MRDAKAGVPTRTILALVTEPRTRESVLNAALDLERRFACEHLTVLHAARMSESPDGAWERLVWSATWARVCFVARAGDPVEGALEQACDCDLIVTAESGMLTQRLLRRAACSILTLPPGASAPRGPLLVPIDFGPDSMRAARFAARLAAAEERPMDLLHVFEVPTGYHKLGPSYAEFARSMEARVRRDLAVFRAELGTDRPVRCRALLGGHAASTILREARTGRYGQIVLGSRRRSPAVTLLFGSVAERVVLSSPLPVWVVRDNSTLSFLEAIE